MPVAQRFDALLGALAGELDRLHADALSLQDDLSSLVAETAQTKPRVAGVGLQRLDALTQGLQALGEVSRGLAAAAPAAAIDLDVLQRPLLSKMAVRLGWPASADTFDPGEDCELF